MRKGLTFCIASFSVCRRRISFRETNTIWKKSSHKSMFGKKNDKNWYSQFLFHSVILVFNWENTKSFFLFFYLNFVFQHLIHFVIPSTTFSTFWHQQIFMFFGIFFIEWARTYVINICVKDMPLWSLTMFEIFWNWLKFFFFWIPKKMRPHFSEIKMFPNFCKWI